MKPINIIGRNINVPTFFSQSNYYIVFAKIKNFSNWSFCNSYSNKIIFTIFFIVIGYIQESFPQEHGTIVICVIRNDTIWVAADSKVINQHRFAATEDSTCKIIRFDDFVFSSAGVFTNKPTNFNIQSLITEIRSRTIDFYEMKEAFAKEVVPFFNWIGGNKVNDIKDWNRTVKIAIDSLGNICLAKLPT